MPVLDLVDDTYVARAATVVAVAVHQDARWRAWWPGLRLTVTRDRGSKGLQWVARPAPDLALRTWRGRPVRWAGSLEIWLEPWQDGTVVHHYQRLDPQGGTVLPPGPVDRLRAARARAWKISVLALKDELEDAGPLAGVKPGDDRADDAGR